MTTEDLYAFGPDSYPEVGPVLAERRVRAVAAHDAETWARAVRAVTEADWAVAQEIER